MGTVSSHGTPKPVAPGTPGQGEPAPPVDGSSLATQTTVRIRIPEKRMPLGPKLSTIFATIALVAWGLYLLLRPPQRVPFVNLPKFVAFDLNLEPGSTRDCKANGCFLFLLGTDVKTQESIPSAVALAEELEARGVETTFVVTGGTVKECSRVARLFRRPVLLDPEGVLQKELSIPQLPYFIVHETAGKIRHRSEEAMTASQVLRAAGL